MDLEDLVSTTELVLSSCVHRYHSSVIISLFLLQLVIPRAQQTHIEVETVTGNGESRIH